MKEGTENMMKKRSYWAGVAALALSLLLTGCGMELLEPVDGVDGAPGLYMEDDGPALDAVVGTDGLDAAGNEEDGAAAPLPGVPEEDPGTTADDGQLYEDPAALDEDGTYNWFGGVTTTSEDQENALMPAMMEGGTDGFFSSVNVGENTDPDAEVTVGIYAVTGND